MPKAEAKTKARAGRGAKALRLARNPVRLWLVLCAVFVAGWLLWAGVRFACSRLMPNLTVDLSEIGLQDVEAMADGSYVTTSGDAQLLIPLPEGGLPLAQVLVEASFEGHPHEMELFYTRKPGQGFSLRKRVIGVPQQTEAYLYNLPLTGNTLSLRIDMGSLSGNRFTRTRIVLNPRLSAAYYFTPSLRGLAALCVVPALACCAIYYIMEVFSALRKKRQNRRGGGNEVTV